MDTLSYFFVLFCIFKVSQNHEGEDGITTYRNHVPMDLFPIKCKLFIENISKILSLMSRWTCSLCSIKLSILLKLKMIA